MFLSLRASPAQPKKCSDLSIFVFLSNGICFIGALFKFLFILFLPLEQVNYKCGYHNQYWR